MRTNVNNFRLEGVGRAEAGADEFDEFACHSDARIVNIVGTYFSYKNDVFSVSYWGQSRHRLGADSEAGVWP